MTTIADATTFGELLDRRCELTPDAFMLADALGDSVTFAQFRDRVMARAGGLASLGVERGANVCWQLPNTVEALTMFAALALLGARQVPLLMGFRQRELTT